MAKYDWAELKREYMVSDCKSLREFADNKQIPYNGYFAKATTGWADEKRAKREQKESKITDDVISAQVEYEIDRNTAHLAAGDIIMAKLNVALQGLKVTDKKLLPKLKTAAETLERVQKSQRLGEGKKVDQSLLLSLLDVLEADDAD